MEAYEISFLLPEMRYSEGVQLAWKNPRRRGTSANEIISQRYPSVDNHYVMKSRAAEMCVNCRTWARVELELQEHF